MRPFDHENLDVYKAAIEFDALADGIVRRLPRWAILAAVAVSAIAIFNSSARFLK